MGQQMIAIIVLFGVRFVLLAIPAFDNFWLWAMRRYLQCVGNGASATNDGEDDEPQVSEPRDMPTEEDRSSIHREQLPIQDSNILYLLLQLLF